MEEKARDWLEQARVDLKTAHDLLPPQDYYAASFFAQQAAEKALKALLIAKGTMAPKVHDLVFLAKKTTAPEDLIKKCDELTWVYIETRYPDLPGGKITKKFTREITLKHLVLAEEILQWAEKQISIS